MRPTLSDFLRVRGVNRVQLAERTRIAISTIDRLLKGDGRPHRKTLKRVAESLGISVGALLNLLKAERLSRSESPEQRMLRTGLAACGLIEGQAANLTPSMKACLRKRMEKLIAAAAAARDALSA